MRNTALFAAAILLASPAYASDTSDVKAAVNQYDADFNKGDMKAFAAMCVPQTVIIDDFTPFVWQGATACSDWATAIAALSKKDGDTNQVVALGPPWQLTITRDRAYAVYPTHYNFKHKGKAMSMQGEWTLALQKLPAGWRITGWAWSDR